MDAPPDVRAQLRTLSIPKDRRPASGLTPRRTGRFILRLLFVLLLIALPLAGFLAKDQITAVIARSRPAPPIPRFTVTASQAPTAPALLTATGKIVSDHRVQVATKVSGQIVAMHFEQGDRVEKGAVLARVEDVLYRARRDEAVARLAKAKANFEFQKVNYARVASLIQGESAPPIEYADAQRWMLDAEAQIAAEQAALEFAQKALDDTEVTAPIAGVILTRNVEVGDFVAAEGGRGANANAQFATIADMTKLRVEVDVSELDIARIQAGMYCTVTPDAYKDRRYEGSVLWLDPGANYSKATVQVKVRIENPDDFLRVEGSAQVAFLSERPSREGAAARAPTIWIPATACILDPGGATAKVFVAQDDRFLSKLVSVGRQVGGQVEITSGLTPGQSIAAERLDQLAAAP